MSRMEVEIIESESQVRRADGGSEPLGRAVQLVGHIRGLSKPSSCYWGEAAFRRIGATVSHRIRWCFTWPGSARTDGSRCCTAAEVHGQWTAQRGAGQAVRREWLTRFDLRGGGMPDIRA